MKKLILLLTTIVFFASCTETQKNEQMNKNKLTVVAKIVAKEEKRDVVKAELLKLIETTRKEEGCINYNLHQDNENLNTFLFYENWESKELLEQHLKNKHLVDYMKNTEGAVEEFILNEYTEIDN